jgi:hypothetical protein
MGQPIPAQHPSVVLRSHFKLVKALLAIAMAAVIALTAAVVILANDEDQVSGGTTSARPTESINYGGFNPATGRPDTVQQKTLPAGTRFDGGPDEGTRGPKAAVLPEGTRFDGGPDEGTRGPQSYQQAPELRFKERAGGPQMMPLGGPRP